MKKIILLLMICMLGYSAANAITVPDKLKLGTTAADTLVASVVKTYTFDVFTNFTGKANILLFTDSISGVPAYSAVLSGSIDGLLYVPLDTISHSGGADKLAYFAPFEMIFNKYKIVLTATSAAQKSKVSIYGVLRY